MATTPTPIKNAMFEDIVAILGDIDQDKVLAIVDLRPTMAEVEAASLWLSGDDDVFGAGEPLKGNAAAIVNILSANEEDERSR
ncbi:hypothetical protein DW352_09800 [Pseudolabrys taiwanensis]|uniref:Uncharacterized protein n=1 Tax=Pseudolabrys taiwanensis TaxID=331696 RepID=A0A346A465_9HYPH|nr:hypothetical protein [Pseudolabrys taiwanensis]AXK83962.1 hypothetical protein DW352_09800 [Pseudolabrys taiwanensis]